MKWSFFSFRFMAQAPSAQAINQRGKWVEVSGRKTGVEASGKPWSKTITNQIIQTTNSTRLWSNQGYTYESRMLSPLSNPIFKLREDDNLILWKCNNTTLKNYNNYCTVKGFKITILIFILKSTIIYYKSYLKYLTWKWLCFQEASIFYSQS